MSVNYYFVKKSDNSIKDEIIKAFESYDYEKVYDLSNELLKNNVIHIGKISSGWKFLFNANEKKFYEPTYESINNFISNENGFLKDEYGNTVMIKDFWDMVKSSMNDNRMDNKKYYEKKYEFYDYEFYHKKENEQFKDYNPKYGQFYNDGLLFSILSDFS